MMSTSKRTRPASSGFSRCPRVSVRSRMLNRRLWPKSHTRNLHRVPSVRSRLREIEMIPNLVVEPGPGAEDVKAQPAARAAHRLWGGRFAMGPAPELDALTERLGAGEAPVASDEDVHTLIDRLLHEEVGEVASKLHTGRSRNDQVATATRLWAMEACTMLDGAVRN